MVHDFWYHRILPQLVDEACDFRVENELFFGGGVGGDAIVDDSVAVGLKYMSACLNKTVEGRRALHIPDHRHCIGACPHPLLLMKLATHSITRRLTVNSDLPHCQYNRLCRINQIPIDCHSVSQQLFLGKPILMDDFHLFDDGRFA